MLPEAHLAVRTHESGFVRTRIVLDDGFAAGRIDNGTQMPPIVLELRLVTERVGSRLESPKDEWSGTIRIRQPIYQGGRLKAAWRTAKLTREEALLNYYAVVADSLLDVRTAYYDVLLAEQEEQNALLVLDTIETDDTYGIAVQSSNEVLLEAINATLAEIIDASIYAEIYARWFEGEVPSRFAR